MAAADGVGGRIRTRRRRRKHSKIRIHKPRWIDPFPWIPGTEVEKRVFAELVRLRIFFRFQFDLPAEEIKRAGFITIPGFHPDFIVPEYKVIIDPFGDFHHTLPEAMRRDAWKKAMFEAAGYATYFPWHTEIIKHGAAAALAKVKEFDRAPTVELKDPLDLSAKLTPGFRLGPHLGLGSKSVGAANRARARLKNPLPKRSLRSRRKRSTRGR